MNLAADSIREQLDIETQRLLVDQARAVCRESPLVRPVARGGQTMSVRVTAAGSLGWVGDGRYHYTREDSRGRPWPAMPREWTDIADHVAGVHPWDSAIVNWYDAGSSLGWHRDTSERDQDLPIVTISLGDSCSWAVRLDVDERVHRCRLDSGAVTLLAGPTRLALHTVERVIASPLLSPLDRPGRVSITVRVAG